MNIYYNLIKFFNSPTTKYPIALLPVVIAIIFITKHSCLTPAASAGYDAAVFSTIGFSWLNGLIPYRDLIDHKGPVLYLINLAGWAIADRETGIYFIECVFSTLSILLVIYVCRARYLTAVIAIFLLFLVQLKYSFEGGNLTEEYATFFSIISLAYAFSNTKNTTKYFAYGVCGALSFYTRPNLAAVPLILLFFDLYDNYSIREVFKTFVLGGSGFALISAPIIVYFSINNALFDFYNIYLVSNIHYTQSVKDTSGLYALFKHSLYFQAVLILGLIIIYLTTREYFVKSILIITFSVICSFISLRAYYHYMQGVTPAYLYILMCICTKGDWKSVHHNINCFIRQHERHVRSATKVFAALIPTVILAAALHMAVIANFNAFNETVPNAYKSSFDSIGIDKKSKILNLGGGPATSIFYYTKTLPIEKVFFPLTFLPSWYSEEFKLKNKSEKYMRQYDFILVSNETNSEIIQQHFFPVGNFKGYKIYKNKSSKNK